MGVKSLDDVYDMSFAEFQIRLFAWERTQEREWEKIRVVAWYSAIGPHLDAKKLPKDIRKFMPLGLDKKNAEVSDEMKKAFVDAMADYLLKKKD